MKKSYKTNLIIFSIICLLLISFVNVLHKFQNQNNNSVKINKKNESKFGVHFSYPSDLKLEQNLENDHIILSHYIKYEGLSICDPVDSEDVLTSTPKSKIETDNENFDELDYEIKIVSSSIRHLFPDFDKYIQPDAFGNSYLEEIRVGNVIGYSALNAVEMCGWINNYFPRPYGTLIISQNAEKIALRAMGKFKGIEGALSDEDIKKIMMEIVETASFKPN